MISSFRQIAVCCLGLVAVLPVIPADAAAPPPDALSKALKRADQLLAAKKLTEAEAAFHEAEALSGGPCGECLLGLGGVRGLEGKWNEAAELTQRSLPLLTQPSSLARAYNQLALAYAAAPPSKNQLTDAEQAARKAVDYGGAWGEAARRNLAQILFLEKRWQDVIPVAREALKRAGTDHAAADTSRVLLCNARSHLPEDDPEELKLSWEKMKEAPTPPTRPVKISGPIPIYTSDAKAHDVQGVVVLDSVIDEEGCVSHLRVTTGLPYGLSEVALATVRQWVFSPAVFEGRPVKVFYTLTVNFKTSGP